MNAPSQFNIFAYVVSAAVYFAIGALWYGKPLFGNAWAKASGVPMGGSSFPVLPMTGQLAASFLYALGVYMVVMLGGFADLKGALVAGGSIVGFFVVPLNSGSLLFTRKYILFLIDGGYESVGAIVMALILTLWR